MSDEKNFKYCARQFQLATLRAQWWMASVTSGHYKQRGLQRGTEEKSEDGRIVFRDCTDEEKLDAAMKTIQRHLEFANECSETLCEGEELDKQSPAKRDDR